MNTAVLPAFYGVGIELEYMIVDRETLAVRPISDQLLQTNGTPQQDVDRGRFGWSNEMVLHLIELKNVRPDPAIEPLVPGFQSEIAAINRALLPLDAQLMPTGMHPWMKPATEAHLWPHTQAALYQTYDRIFGCHTHGQANLQSMQVNLPFANDAEFERLHAAVRLILPVLPALAASSPLIEGQPSGYLDTRLEGYRNAVRRVPSVIGDLIPDTTRSEADYQRDVLAPMYRDMAPFDAEGILQHEWLNARGAIPRFDRHAIEVRVIDMQECVQADLAIAAATVAATRYLYSAEPSPLARQQQVPTAALAALLRDCTRSADQTVIDDGAYLKAMGLPSHPCTTGELWDHLIDATRLDLSPAALASLQIIRTHGPLARRILAAAGLQARDQKAVYQALCDCLARGCLFTG